MNRAKSKSLGIRNECCDLYPLRSPGSWQIRDKATEPDIVEEISVEPSRILDGNSPAELYSCDEKKSSWCRKRFETFGTGIKAEQKFDKIQENNSGDGNPVWSSSAKHMTRSSQGSSTSSSLDSSLGEFISENNVHIEVASNDWKETDEAFTPGNTLIPSIDSRITPSDVLVAAEIQIATKDFCLLDKERRLGVSHTSCSECEIDKQSLIGVPELQRKLPVLEENILSHADNKCTRERELPTLKYRRKSKENKSDQYTFYNKPCKRNGKLHTKIIQVEGITYRLTMEPPDERNGEKLSEQNIQQTSTSVDAAKDIARIRVRNITTRSASVSEAEIRKLSSRMRSSSEDSDTSTNLQRISSPFWKKEREKLALNVDLAQQVSLPSEPDHQPNGDIDHPRILPGFDSKDALNCAALRLRRISQELNNSGTIPDVINDTLKYAVSVLEMRFLDDSEEEDETQDQDSIVPLQGDNVVPPEIKRWLMQTFSTSGMGGAAKRVGERRTLRSVVHAMQAGMFVERMFRKSSAASGMHISPEIQLHLKDIGKLSFDVFELEQISDGNALKYVMYELLNKYDFMRKYKFSSKTLFSYCERLQAGYRKHNNQYHNPIHAADVAQCVSYFLNESGFINWLSDLEVFAMIFAGAIHDLEHTGTTNNFHTQTRSNLALLYNDRSVLENHHVSAAFRILWEDPECDMLSSLSKEDYRQFRDLVIDMVLATDMSRHFGQIKNMKSMLQHPENMERSKAMSLMLHCADINHPTRPWELHHRWTEKLVEEFFEQGDKERELDLPISPLCDRHSTMVAQSQIGFIDYVIKPTFELLTDLFWKVSNCNSNNDSNEKEKGGKSSTGARKSHDDSEIRRFSEPNPLSNKVKASNTISNRVKEFRNSCNNNIINNRQRWHERDEIEQAQRKETEGTTQHSPESKEHGNKDESSTT